MSTQASTVEKYSPDERQQTSPPRFTNFPNPSHHISDTRRQSRKKDDLATHHMADSNHTASQVLTMTKSSHYSFDNKITRSQNHILPSITNLLSQKACVHQSNKYVLHRQTWLSSNGPLISNQAALKAQCISKHLRYKYDTFTMFHHKGLVVEQAAFQAHCDNFGL